MAFRKGQSSLVVRKAVLIASLIRIVSTKFVFRACCCNLKKLSFLSVFFAWQSDWLLETAFILFSKSLKNEIENLKRSNILTYTKQVKVIAY